MSEPESRRCTLTTPTQKELAQACVELNAAAIGKREFVRRAEDLRVTASDKREQIDLADGLDRVVKWIRAHYA